VAAAAAVEGEELTGNRLRNFFMVSTREVKDVSHPTARFDHY